MSDFFLHWFFFRHDCCFCSGPRSPNWCFWCIPLLYSRTGFPFKPDFFLSFSRAVFFFYHGFSPKVARSVLPCVLSNSIHSVQIVLPWFFPCGKWFGRLSPTIVHGYVRRTADFQPCLYMVFLSCPFSRPSLSSEFSLLFPSFPQKFLFYTVLSPDYSLFARTFPSVPLGPISTNLASLRR